jgi:hypothetical protein
MKATHVAYVRKAHQRRSVGAVHAMAVQRLSGASIPLSLKAVCKVMVAAVRYRGSLIAALIMWIAAVHQWVSRCSGVNSEKTLTASPSVATTPSLQTNSNASGVVLSNPVHLPWRGPPITSVRTSAARYWRSILTMAVPALIMSSSTAAARLRSMIRPRPYGPRSTMRTTTVLPLRWFVTLTCVPNGKVRWAAVSPLGPVRSPLAVRPPL